MGMGIGVGAMVATCIFILDCEMELMLLIGGSAARVGKAVAEKGWTCDTGLKDCASMDHAPKKPKTLVTLIHRRSMFLKAFIFCFTFR